MVKKISIIMPVFNDEKYLNEAIESVCNQTISDIELICVNDGSSDNSLDILNKLSAKYDFIKVFSQENQGAGSARNKGLDNAFGEYIAFLDADDFYLDNNALKIMYDVASSKNANMVSANLISVNQSREILNKNNNCKKKYTCFDEYCEISPDEYGIPWSFYKNIFKRELIESNDIRFPDLLRGQDPVFLAEILSKINKIYGVPIKYYGYMLPPAGKNLLNTPIKKYHYMIHYKQTFDILEGNNLVNNSDKYKKDLIKRLDNFSKQHDIEGFEIFLEIFGEKHPYLSKYHHDLDYLHIKYLFEKLFMEDSQVYFDVMKKKISKINIYDNNKISDNLFKKIILLKNHKYYQKFKEDYLEFEFKNKTQEVKILTKNNKKLINKYKKANKLNKKLQDSKSYKLIKKFKQK